MKKTMTALAIALTLGVIGSQIANAGPGRGWRGGWGPGRCNAPYCNTEGSEKWQAFRKDTADLRRQLSEKRAEYFDLMNGENIDKHAAQSLWSEMFDLKSQIREKAKAAGIDPQEVFGRGRGWRGYACNGPRRGGYFCGGPDGVPFYGPGSCRNR
jgi:Spy/CpxP family protein refolding chaperone